MARHLDIAKTPTIRVYFCDSHSPWQRGSNGSTNGLLRQYFLKGAHSAAHTPGTCARSRTSSIADPESSLATAHPSTSSTSCWPPHAFRFCDVDESPPARTGHRFQRL